MHDAAREAIRAVNGFPCITDRMPSCGETVQATASECKVMASGSDGSQLYSQLDFISGARVARCPLSLFSLQPVPPVGKESEQSERIRSEALHAFAIPSQV